MISIYSETEITKSLQLMKLLYTIYSEYLDLYIWFFVNKDMLYKTDILKFFLKKLILFCDSNYINFLRMVNL